MTDDRFLNVGFHQKSVEIRLTIPQYRFRAIILVDRNIIALYKASSFPDEPKWTGIPVKSWLSVQSVYPPVLRIDWYLGSVENKGIQMNTTATGPVLPKSIIK